jgi:hypothetical protein
MWVTSISVWEMMGGTVGAMFVGRSASVAVTWAPTSVTMDGFIPQMYVLGAVIKVSTFLRSVKPFTSWHIDPGY